MEDNENIINPNHDDSTKVIDGPAAESLKIILSRGLWIHSKNPFHLYSLRLNSFTVKHTTAMYIGEGQVCVCLNDSAIG